MSLANFDVDADDSDYECSSSIVSSSSTANESALENYVDQAKVTIFSHDDINIENALELNKKLQEALKILKLKLESLLSQCHRKYKTNELLLDRLHKTPRVSLIKQHRKYSFFFCGKPYFKDRFAIGAPPNADYVYRKNVLKEFFPIDSAHKSTNWVTKDKVFLIQGVKDQLIRTLLSRTRDQARNVKTGTRGASKKRLAIIEDGSQFEKMRLSELYQMIDASQPFKIDWFSISAENLDGRHAPCECAGIWNGYLNPMLNRKKWTAAEEEKLLELSGAYNAQNWEAIAKQMPGRSGYQCLVQYQNVLSDRNTVKSVRWTKDEDDLLLSIIEKCRIGSMIPWSSVVEKMPNRTKAQVYNRFTFTLKPGIKKEKFTVEEDCILMAAVKEYGTSFHKFPSHLLPGRTLVQIRNRYNNVLKFVGKSRNWTEADDQQLMNLVEKYGTTDWRSISDELQTHTRFSCRSRYTTITKFLEKNPKATVKDVPKKKRPFSSNVTEDNWMETIINVKQYGTAEPPAPDRVYPVAGKNAVPCRSIYTDYYEFFKYSHKFRYETIYPPDVHTNSTGPAVCQVLYNNVCPKDYKILTDADGVAMDMEYKSYAERSKCDFVLPPSWSTALLLRGLSIMFPKIANYKRTGLAMTPKLNEEESALLLFRKRFVTLLYSTILMSKLKFPNHRQTETTVIASQSVDATTTVNNREPDSTPTFTKVEIEIFDEGNYMDDNCERNANDMDEYQEGNANEMKTRIEIVDEVQSKTFHYDFAPTESKFKLSLVNNEPSTSGKRKHIGLAGNQLSNSKKNRLK